MARNNILVVVDYQVDFVDGTLGFVGAKEIETGLANKIKRHWEDGGVVVFTYDTHNHNYMETNEGHNLPVAHCLYGTPGWELYGKVKEVHDWGVDSHKPYYDIRKGTFGSVTLIDVIQEIMERFGISESELQIEFTGVVTNICVISNAVMAKSTVPNADIFVNSSLCASNDLSMENKAYDIMRNLHIKVF